MTAIRQQRHWQHMVETSGRRQVQRQARQCLAGLAVLALLILLLFTQQLYRAGQQAEAGTELLVRQLVVLLQPALLTHDRLAMQRVLDTAVDEAYLTGLQLRDAEGRVLAAAGQAEGHARQNDVRLDERVLAQLWLYRPSVWGASAPWLALLLALSVLAALAGLQWRVWREASAPLPAPPPPPRPEPGLQWPVALTGRQPFAVLSVAVSNQASLVASLSAGLLRQHGRDVLQLLDSALGGETVPVLPLAPGRWLLLFEDVRLAVAAARTLAARLEASNQTRRTEGTLALRLHAALLEEGDAAANEPAERWLALQRQAQSLLDMGSVYEAGELVLAAETGERLQTLLPDFTLEALHHDDGSLRAWRWLSAANAIED